MRYQSGNGGDMVDASKLLGKAVRESTIIEPVTSLIVRVGDRKIDVASTCCDLFTYHVAHGVPDHEGGGDDRRPDHQATDDEGGGALPSHEVAAGHPEQDAMFSGIDQDE